MLNSIAPPFPTIHQFQNQSLQQTGFNQSRLVFSQSKKKKNRKNRKKKDPNAETSGTGFQILGEQIDKNRNKVARVLPSWLAKPDFVSVDLSDQQMPVDEMKGKFLNKLSRFAIFISSIGIQS